MRKISLIFAMCTTLASFAYADDNAETARSAARNTQAVRTNAPAVRGKNEIKKTTDVNRSAVVRKIAPSNQTGRDNSQRQQVVSRAAVQNKIMPSKTAEIEQARRPSNNTVSRASATRTIMPSNLTRTQGISARNAQNLTTKARAASTSKVVGAAISDKYVTCRTTYFSCMDEFCANKDASLRRCACSARLHDFDKDKQVVANVQSKLTDFNQRLLAVNMDKEDAAAITKSTEGEDAANQKDVSSSQKALNDILKKINDTTSDTQQTQSLAQLNLSTAGGGDMFDSVDSMMGADTATKEGEALYNAALPTCIDMAKEVCETADISIIQSAYQMSIEQDCNTLEKNYNAMKDTALNKAQEGSALLDMSRLTNYQDRNSGDLLACTKQMMDSLDTSSVCGADLGKCLDWSGKYIDPSTGKAILTSDLANLASLLSRPAEGTKWVDIPANQDMVKFLNSKKTYIEPAMKNCESIEQTVWDNFVEDALSKIKVEQEKRLEDIRQNCTILVGQCKETADKSIQDFDSRALSIFGINSDTTVNSMCNDIQSSCSALMKNYLAGGETANGNGQSQTGQDWSDSMDKIDMQKTYATILQNCKLVGQECVQLQCQTNDNKFALCTEQISGQRRNILNIVLDNNYCYNEVKNCVEQTPLDKLDKIVADPDNTTDFPVTKQYMAGDGTIPADQTTISSQMKIAQNIWGGCNTQSMADDTNTILPGNTILSWFGDNTTNSCYTGYCPDGFYYLFGAWDAANQKWPNVCAPYGTSGYEACDADISKLTAGGISNLNDNTVVSVYKLSSSGLPNELIYPNANTYATPGNSVTAAGNGNYFSNCCFSTVKDTYGNCCENVNNSPATNPTNLGSSRVQAILSSLSTTTCNPAKQCCFEDPIKAGSAQKYCRPAAIGWNYVATNNNTHLFCLGTLIAAGTSPDYRHFGQDDQTYTQTTCSGTFVTVDTNGVYRSRLSSTGTEKYLNYVYDNTSQDPDSNDMHHLIYIYMPADASYTDATGTIPVSKTSPSTSGYYRVAGDISSVDTAPIKSHLVAYCDNGFEFSVSKRIYQCCTVPGTCQTYRIIP